MRYLVAKSRGKVKAHENDGEDPWVLYVPEVNMVLSRPCGMKTSKE